MTLQISVPKAGTHLFGQMTQCRVPIIALKEEPQETLAMQFADLESLKTNLNGRVTWLSYRAHLPYYDELEPIVTQFEHVILVLRDPRDIVVSWAHFVERLTTSPLNTRVDQVQLSDKPFGFRIDFLIEHIRPLLLLFEPWRTQQYVHVFRFEEYQCRPFEVINRLHLLGFGDTEEIAKRAHIRGATFRTGISNNWLAEFSGAQKRRAECCFGDIIDAWRDDRT